MSAASVRIVFAVLCAMWRKMRRPAGRLTSREDEGRLASALDHIFAAGQPLSDSALNAWLPGSVATMS